LQGESLDLSHDKSGSTVIAHMTPESQVEAMLRGQIADIVAGTVFVFIGVSACLIAAIRRRSGVRLVLWLGIWSAMYGVLQLSRGDSSFVAALPLWLQRWVPLANTASLYLILVVATIAFLEITIGPYRIFLLVVIFSALGIAIAAIAIFLRTGLQNSLILYNNLLATCSLVVLLIIVMVPRLSRRYIALPSRGVLAAGMLVFAAEALLANLMRSLHLRDAPILDSIGFAILLFSFGYVALQRVAASERRLLAIESELEIARQLQFSILPREIPSVKNLRIAAVYEPMTAVAGDFYEFLPVDEYRAGFLVADVSGHGVPAALIASMIKVAMQTVAEWAQNPAEVLRRLGSVLSGQLRGQFITAAYLWIDMEVRRAHYSAAGHPPLLCLRRADGALERIESNGLLFGVTAESDYPVGEVALQSGDRFLMYTDGIVEPENAAGEAFGDRRLEQIMRENPLLPASELCQRLLVEVVAWQPSSRTQQDDITLILIDVL